LTMQRKLMGITHIGGVLAVVPGLLMVVLNPTYLQFGWLHAKLVLVVLLIGYHLWCWRLVGVFQRGENRRGHVWYRWFNEVPAVLLIAIVVLAVVKPL
ncbi:MAG: CopD family protein, partial [Pseudomonadota bacterium]